MVCLAITNSINSQIDLIKCDSLDEAKKKMCVTYSFFLKVLDFDENNTFIDTDNNYAQIANGLEVFEMRIGIAN